MPHLAKNLVFSVGPIVGRGNPIERASRFEQGLFRGYDCHGACLQPVFNEHTHRRHVGSAPTSNPRRNVRKFSLTMRASGFVRTFPTGSWKKHGRTPPPASTTTDTHGALQRTGGNGRSPRSAA
jgi:hypothetical protein